MRPGRSAAESQPCAGATSQRTPRSANTAHTGSSSGTHINHRTGNNSRPPSPYDTSPTYKTGSSETCPRATVGRSSRTCVTTPTDTFRTSGRRMDSNLGYIYFPGVRSLSGTTHGEHSRCPSASPVAPATAVVRPPVISDTGLMGMNHLVHCPACTGTASGGCQRRPGAPFNGGRHRHNTHIPRQAKTGTECRRSHITDVSDAGHTSSKPFHHHPSQK
ncbi:MAG: hypothetical protein QG608_1672 [Actinomycetota bacterium]|nr:hypothetical protein [Actinomycetota bacterium]